jgi:hypothetical protein
MAKDLNWNSQDPRKRLAMLTQLRAAMNPGAAGMTDKEFTDRQGTSWEVGVAKVGYAKIERYS